MTALPPVIASGRFVLIIPKPRIEIAPEVVSPTTQPLSTSATVPQSAEAWEAIVKHLYEDFFQFREDDQEDSRLCFRGPSLPTAAGLEVREEGGFPRHIGEERADNGQNSAEEERLMDERGCSLPYDGPIHMLLDERYPFERLCEGDFTFTILHPRGLKSLSLDIDDKHSADDLLRRLTISRHMLTLVRRFRLYDRRSSNRRPLTSRQFADFLRFLPNCTDFAIEDINVIRDAMPEHNAPLRSANLFSVRFSKAFTSTVRSDLFEVLLAPFSKLERLELELYRAHLLEGTISLPEGAIFEEVQDLDDPSAE